MLQRMLPFSKAIIDQSSQGARARVGPRREMIEIVVHRTITGNAIKVRRMTTSDVDAACCD